MDSHPIELKKLLGRWDSVAIMISIVIGVGIFRVPAEVAGLLPSPWLIMAAWLLGGLISLTGALCYAEISSSFPKTGGDYVYLKESYGHLTAFLFGWTELLVIRGGSIAAVAFIFAEYLSSFCALPPVFVKPCAIGVILALAVINAAGLRYGRRVQTVFTIAKISALALIILWGFLSGKGSGVNFSGPFIRPGTGFFSSFGLAMIPILWTYGGWHENTYVAGETRNAVKNLPFALIYGVMIITVLYMAINFLYLYIIPVREMAGAQLIASDVLKIVYGTAGSKILEALVIVSSVGSINAMIITGSRITYAMGSDSALFRYLGKAHPGTRTPLRSIIVNGIWASLLIVWGNFNQLMFYTGILMWLFIALVTGGLFILRHKHPHIERPYTVWGYPVLPAVFIGITVLLFLNTFIFDPVPSLIGLIILACGVPVYYVSHRYKERKMMGNPG